MRDLENILYAAVATSNRKVIGKLFTCDVMLSALALFDYQHAPFTLVVLGAVRNAVFSINCPGMEAHECFNLFEKKFAEIVNDLIFTENNDVKVAVIDVPSCSRDTDLSIVRWEREGTVCMDVVRIQNVVARNLLSKCPLVEYCLCFL